jgi:phosphatidylinositol kinase/protein kinase (PI-3  family)
MQDSVNGLFDVAQRVGMHQMDGYGYELLQSWEKAKAEYKVAISRQVVCTNSEKEGFVRCLCLCGDWAEALHAARSFCGEFASADISSYGAMAAWILGEWDEAQSLTERMPSDVRPLQRFFLAGIEFSRDPLGKSCSAFIDEARRSVETSLRALLPVSYTHAYDHITLLQNYQEIHEANLYRQSSSPHRRSALRHLWTKRFLEMKSDNLLARMRSMMVYSLVVCPREMPEVWMNFCDSLRSVYPHLSHWAMKSLQLDDAKVGASAELRPSAVMRNDPSVQMGYFKHLWMRGMRVDAIEGIQCMLTRFPALEQSDPYFFGQAHLHLALWLQEIFGDAFLERGNREVILGHLVNAISNLAHESNTWHCWALMNYRIHQRDRSLSPEETKLFVEKAHQGFVCAISSSESTSKTLQDCVRLLQLWVVHGGIFYLKDSVGDSIQRIPVDHWVEVVPQLIAHLSHDSYQVRNAVSAVLKRICVERPPAVVFPLLVGVVKDALRLPDDGESRREQISKELLQHVPNNMKTDAFACATQLNQIAALPVEVIYQNLMLVLDEWRIQTKNCISDSAVRRLKTVTYICRNPSYSQSILKLYGDIGKYADHLIEMAADPTKNDYSINLLHDLVTELSQLKKHETVVEELQEIVKPLAKMRNLSVCMFGMYRCASSYVTIASIDSRVLIIPSKKSPRKISFTGSNGAVYNFLLKSGEDIRLDERVMQLFGLINSFLQHAPNAMVYRFPIVPLTGNSGLLGWVEHSETMHDIVSNYRRDQMQEMQMEVRVLADQFDVHQYDDFLRVQWRSLMNIQRAGAIEDLFVSKDCESADLARSMWTLSPSAEVWIDRRTTYTQSLAAMSMAGYVLGLGDRHLGNLMMIKSTGKVVHIDFGDSFDVCRVRAEMPETIPFRLTRMLVHAMEVFGVNGVFQSTCHDTLQHLRENRDSIIALLSAFIYDPIVSHQTNMRTMMSEGVSPQYVVERIRRKLRGLELAVAPDDLRVFKPPAGRPSRPDIYFMSAAFDDTAPRDVSASLSTKDQVAMLIQEATSVENLSSVYHGWNALW